MRSVYRAGAIVVLLSGALVGCAADDETASVHYYDEISGELQLQEGPGEYVLDLSTSVDLEWDRVVLACSGNSPDQISDAIGFDWPGSDRAEQPVFEGMAIVIRKATVVLVVDPGLIDRPLYFIPCPNPDEVPEGVVGGPLSLERECATLHLQFWRPYSYWYLPLDRFRDHECD